MGKLAMLVYETENPKISSGCANDAWAEHFANALTLRYIARHDASFETRAIAAAELVIAETTMARCAKRAEFSAPVAAHYAQERRAEFKPVRDYRAFPELTEGKPDTSKCRKVIYRSKANRKSEHRATWPLMRTRDNVPFGLIG